MILNTSCGLVQYTKLISTPGHTFLFSKVHVPSIRPSLPLSISFLASTTFVPPLSQLEQISRRVLVPIRPIMASTSGYGEMFHTLAGRLKQHNEQSKVRTSPQPSERSESQTANPSYPVYRGPTYTSTEHHSTCYCQSCHSLRRTSTVYTASARPVTLHVGFNDEYFRGYGSDVRAPNESPSSPTHRQPLNRSSLLSAYSEDSSSNHTSPSESHSRASVDPPKRPQSNQNIYHDRQRSSVNAPYDAVRDCPRG